MSGVLQLLMGDNAPAGGGGGTPTTWDPGNLGSSLSLSNGNNTVTASVSSWRSVIATIARSSGKYYFELTCTVTANYHQFGLSDATCDVANDLASQSAAPAIFIDNRGSGGAVSGASHGITTAADFLSTPTYTTGDVLGFAVDITAGKIWAAKNNDYTVYSTSADPAAGTHQAFTVTSPPMTLIPACSLYDGGSHPAALLTASGTFAHTPPSGFSSWS